MVPPCFSLRTPASLAQLMRPAALAGAGGVVSAILGLVSDSVCRDFAEPIHCPTIQDIFHPPACWTLNYPSLPLGILIGLLVGPVLETLVLLRQLWALQIRARFRVQGVARSNYRVLE